MILITGATGFIGSHLTEELAKKNKVRILVRRKSLKKLKRNINIRTLSKIQITIGDLLDKTSLIKATKGIKKVFHLAAIARPMNIPRKKYYQVNVDGTRNLLDACKKNKVKDFIHISTMSVFGYSRDRKPLTENSPKLPVSDYGLSKLIGEDLVINFCKKNKIKLKVVRPPMVFGPRDKQFLKLFRLINTGLFPLLKKGKAKMEFTYVKNLVDGIIKADKCGKNQETYNISDGKTYTISYVFGLIAKYENKKLFPISPPVWLVIIVGKCMELLGKLTNTHPIFNSGTASWMTNNNIMDITKARTKLKYKNIIPINKAIKETIYYYKKYKLLK